MIKRGILFVLGILLLASLPHFVASEDFGCCEELTDGSWCQMAYESECSGNVALSSCEETTFCEKGTCVNEQTGTCTSNTGKGLCESDGGTWYEGDRSDIEVCQIGCCILGQEVAYVNPTECSQLASDYGVDVEFREDVTDQASCFALSNTQEEGACYLGGDSSPDCIRTTEAECTEGTFYAGLLCTASGISDCAKTENTECGTDDRVYFVDTCGNLANVYDDSKYSRVDSDWTQEMLDYWTYISPSDCIVTGPDGTCGNCNYIDGTICGEYKSGQENMPSKSPTYGDNVCQDLSCYYDTNNDGVIDKDTEFYEHGESWCAESEGTFFHIPFDNSAFSSIRDPSNPSQFLTYKEAIMNYSKYNLPGSRYYKLYCYDGEVEVEPCKDYRNSICKETTKTNSIGQIYQHAECVANPSDICLSLSTKSGCEEYQDCVWIAGYQRDITLKEKWKGDEESYSEVQGACYPLYPGGMDFSTEDGATAAETVCAATSVNEFVVYENPLIGRNSDRDKFEDATAWDAAHECIDNCYLIPNYGSDANANYFDFDTMYDFYLKNGNLPSYIDNYYMSKREGAYCLKEEGGEDSIANSKTGSEIGSDIDCSTNNEKDLERRRRPLFFTHELWLEAIKMRAQSTGDCGYKPNLVGIYGQTVSEQITALYQVIDQEFEEQDAGRFATGEAEIIYEGDSYTGEERGNKK